MICDRPYYSKLKLQEIEKYATEIQHGLIILNGPKRKESGVCEEMRLIIQWIREHWLLLRI